MIRLDYVLRFYGKTETGLDGYYFEGHNVWYNIETRAPRIVYRIRVPLKAFQKLVKEQ